MRISTVIPTYNRAELIGDTLRSILSQTRPPAEVIVVDDGSTDGTTDEIRSFGSAVILVRQANAGAGAARNNGFARSTGEIVHFMDSDDISSLNSYEVQAAAIERGADMTYGPWLKTEFFARRLAPEPFVLQQAPLPAGCEIDQAIMLMRWVTVFQPCLFRRSLLTATGPYRTDLRPSEDTELLYRLTRLTRRIVHTPETILLYRVHLENQVSEQDPVRRLVDQANLLSVFRAHAEERADLGRRAAWLFRNKLLKAAQQVRPHAPQLAEALSLGNGTVDRWALHVRVFAERVYSKLRHRISGKAYGTLYRPGRLTAGQRTQIAALGYSLEGEG